MSLSISSEPRTDKDLIISRLGSSLSSKSRDFRINKIEIQSGIWNNFPVYIYSAPIEDVRSFLDLPEFQYIGFIVPDSWIAGGSVLAWLRGRYDYNDVDIFFSNSNAYNRWREVFVGILELDSYIGHNSTFHKVSGGATINTVNKMFFSSPEECIANFDITPSMIAIDQNRVYWSQLFENAFLHMRSEINHVENPLTTIRRLGKYESRGFWYSNQSLIDCIRIYKVRRDLGDKDEWEFMSDERLARELSNNRNGAH